MKVAVIGAGSWGTAVARALGSKGYATSLWCHTPAVADAINEQHRNPRYLCDIDLPGTLTATASFQEAVEGAAAVFIVTPSYAARETARSIAPYLGPTPPVAMLSQGAEKGTRCLLTQVLEQELGNPARIAAISGPNHAEEVSRDIPSATVV
ncbi:MAG: NAD(P)-binding domain-containing protein, partial [Coriobacteriales bacterium]|nr:NAD(P)-binding domain-containing protein [Coriobacteriales bacterium]